MHTFIYRLALTENGSGSVKHLFSSENNMNGRVFIGMGLVIAQQITGKISHDFSKLQNNRADPNKREWGKFL